MRGRPTSDKKEYDIKLRINEELYNEIEKCATRNNCSKSDVVRASLKKFFQ